MSELIYEKFGKILSNDVVQKLVGAHDNFKITQHHSLPSKNILIGALLPKSAETDVSIENLKDLNSISVKCLLDGDISPISMDISFSMYYRVFPSFEQQIEGIKNQGNKKSYSMERVWKRKDISISNVVVDPLNPYNSELDLSEKIDEIKKDVDVVKSEKRIPSEYMQSEEKFEEFLDNLRKEEFEFRWLEKKSFAIGLSSTSMLLDILDFVFCLSLLHKVQLILAVAGILSLKKFRTSKKSRSFLCLLTLIMKYEPYLGEKSFLI